jgi:CO dehydrogenase/acetyl-CoA synthase epsilon subunit
MQEKHLHIISFNIPFPANYGGVIDVFCKLKVLHQQGVKIYLHCFEYDRAEAEILQQYCISVNYYKRKMGAINLLSPLPFVVVTRSSEELINNLLKDTYPILFEGLHSCFYLNDIRLKDRIKIVRTHNIEHDYYNNLASVEKSVFKKIYFIAESKKLKRFEAVLNKANYVAAISAGDTKELSKRYKNVHHITAFHPNEEVKILEGKGDFCLYHGNLEVGENNEAALYLVNKVFSKIKTPLIIAGHNPNKELIEAVAAYPHIQLKANIPTDEIDELIKNAQINVLPTFQATGIKLKLLAALYIGRFCVVNSPMVVNTGLENLCTIEDSPEAMATEIVKLFEMPFDMTEKQKREAILNTAFSNVENAKKLIELI